MESLPRPLLVDRVVEYLAAQLAGHHLSIGSHLNAEHIARQLNISRTTVNKAIGRLVEQGYVRPDSSRRPIVVAFPESAQNSDNVTFEFANQTERTYEAILERLQRGDFSPGETIKESRLAKELRVNAVTVHRAAEWLCNDGVLVRLRRRGWQVVSLNRSELNDIYRVRALLEPLAVRQAARRITEATLERLEERVQRLAEAGDKAEAYERRQLDFDFHHSLAVASGSKVFAETLEPMVRKLLLLAIGNDRGTRIKEDVRDYQTVLAALRKRDSAAAVLAMKNHLRNSQLHAMAVWDRMHPNSEAE
jgi:DNA-binding GntR family transcriptional regulator